MNRHLATMAALGAGALLFAGTALAAGQWGSSNGAKPAAKTTPTATVTNWYGGPAYTGEPALEVTAALVKAGGGAANFSFPQALVAMLGQKTVSAEVAKLTKQYGHAGVNTWLNGMTYAVDEGLKQATAAGVKLPPAPADLIGTKLAAALVKAGTAPDGTFWAGLLFDHALSHKLHNSVMMNINATKGEPTDRTVHAITNQAMFDVAQALGMHHVTLASLH